MVKCDCTKEYKTHTRKGQTLLEKLTAGRPIPSVPPPVPKINMPLSLESIKPLIPQKLTTEMSSEEITRITPKKQPILGVPFESKQSKKPFTPTVLSTSTAREFITSLKNFLIRWGIPKEQAIPMTFEMYLLSRCVKIPCVMWSFKNNFSKQQHNVFTVQLNNLIKPQGIGIAKQYLDPVSTSGTQGSRLDMLFISNMCYDELKGIDYESALATLKTDPEKKEKGSFYQDGYNSELKTVLGYPCEMGNGYNDQRLTLFIQNKNEKTEHFIKITDEIVCSENDINALKEYGKNMVIKANKKLRDDNFIEYSMKCCLNCNAKDQFEDSKWRVDIDEDGEIYEYSCDGETCKRTKITSINKQLDVIIPKEKW